MTIRRRTIVVAVLMVLGAVGCSEQNGGTVANQATGPDKAAGAAEPPVSAVALAQDADVRDACARLPAQSVAEIVDASGPIDASADHLRLVGKFVSACGYRDTDSLRASYTIAADSDGRDFAKLRKAVAAGLLVEVPPVAGHPALVRTDGSLIWSEGGQLHTVSARDSKEQPDPDERKRRALAERAAQE